MYNDVYLKDQYAYSYSLLTKWLKLKIEKKSSADFFAKNNINKIGIYGVSGFGGLLFDELKGTNVKTIFFVDKKHLDWKQGYYGISVLGLSEIKRHIDKVDALVVTPVYFFNQILDDLLKENIEQNKIISLSMVVSE